MKDFIYYTPTTVIFGREADKDVGGYLKKHYHPKKVLIHYGGGSVIRTGILKRVTDSFDRAELPYALLGGVEPNPAVGHVREACKLCRDEGVDFILAVGGGSVIDSSKCLAACAANGLEPWDYMTGAKIQTVIPLGVVLTMAAAGSEMSSNCVITNPELNIKKGRGSTINISKVSFMNPENTFSVPPLQTAAGVCDIMMHTMERYFIPSVDTELTDGISEALLRSVMDAGKQVMEDPRDYEARATLMWASSLSHNSLTGCGKGGNSLLVHKLEHAVSGIFTNVTHGAGLSALYQSWMRYMYQYDFPRFRRFAVNVMGIPASGSDEDIILRGIDALEEYYRSLGLPVSLGDLDIGPENIDRLTELTLQTGAIDWSYIPMGSKEIHDIFTLAL